MYFSASISPCDLQPQTLIPFSRHSTHEHPPSSMHDHPPPQRMIIPPPQHMTTHCYAKLTECNKCPWSSFSLPGDTISFQHLHNSRGPLHQTHQSYPASSPALEAIHGKNRSSVPKFIYLNFYIHMYIYVIYVIIYIHIWSSPTISFHALIYNVITLCNRAWKLIVGELQI